MSRRAKMILVGLTALNAVALTTNVSLPLRAAVGGKAFAAARPWPNRTQPCMRSGDEVDGA
jgi:hypothetical protein